MLSNITATSYQHAMKSVRKLPLLHLLPIFLLSLLPLKATSSPRSQAEALISWKSSFASPPSSLNSWSRTNLNNLCNWTAIVCNQNTKTVAKIDLSNHKITATLTEFNCTPFLSLTHFNLNGNNFTGPIPSAISKLSRLTILDLGNNYFTQEIPEEIGKLTKLEYLSFYNNDLHGTIPVQLSYLQWVRYVLFGKNQLIRTPDGSNFSVMPLLTYLDLSQNNLESKFPVFISKCWNLTFLDLSENALTGQIPEAVFANLGKLEYLNLSDNYFQGRLPTSFPKLKHLHSAWNSFSGQIPEDIGLMSRLQCIDLYQNSLQGRIPSSIGQLRELQYLNLEGIFRKRIELGSIRNFALLIYCS